MSHPASTVVVQHDVPMGSERLLRVSLIRGEHGDVVVLAPGFGDAQRFHRPSWADAPLTLPASSLPELVRVLEALVAP